jgi:S1-C subfamily serine protease
MKKIIFLILTLSSSVHAYELEKIIDQANKYTVKIYNSTETPFLEDSYIPNAGSGFLIDKANGIIITNAHVASYSPA